MNIPKKTLLPDPKLVIAGNLDQEYIITPSGAVHSNLFGGDALYAAAGARMWLDGVCVLAKVGENFPTEWLGLANSFGIDTQGVIIDEKYIESKRFYSYDTSLLPSTRNPALGYLRAKKPFPKELLSLVQDRLGENRSDYDPTRSIRLLEIPKDYLAAKSLLLAGIDLPSQLQLSSFFAHKLTSIIASSQNNHYMEHAHTENLEKMFHGTTLFFTTEQQLRLLFWSHHVDVWQLAKMTVDLGCDMVIVDRGFKGSIILERATQQKWTIPPYSTKITDPTGMHAAFHGGATAGYYLTLDPVEAALYGTVSSSICADGTGPIFMLETLPDLAANRLRNLRTKVMKTEV